MRGRRRRTTEESSAIDPFNHWNYDITFEVQLKSNNTPLSSLGLLLVNEMVNAQQ